jgi:hypothetical protein
MLIGRDRWGVVLSVCFEKEKKQEGAELTQAFVGFQEHKQAVSGPKQTGGVLDPGR